MTDKLNPIPPGRETAIVYLCCGNAAEAIEFYKKAFGATELYRIPMGDAVGHAEIQIGRTTIMLSDEFPQMGVVSPLTLHGSPVTIHMYVADVDAFTKRAMAAGLTELRPVEDQFYGDRGGKFQDPSGHIWWFASRIEDVSPEEMQKRAAAASGQS